MKKNPYADMAQEAANPMPEDNTGTRLDTTVSDGLPENLDEACREYISAARAEAEDARLRSIAEMENFKRRMQREMDERSKYVAESVLADLLPALDSLDLAIQYADKDRDSGMLQGVVMTRKLLLDAMKHHGLEAVGEVTEPFNHELHEAVGEEERCDIPEMCISTMLQRGYKLKDRLLRPAKVMVSRTSS